MQIVTHHWEKSDAHTKAAKEVWRKKENFQPEFEGETWKILAKEPQVEYNIM